MTFFWPSTDVESKAEGVQGEHGGELWKEEDEVGRGRRERPVDGGRERGTDETNDDSFESVSGSSVSQVDGKNRNKYGVGEPGESDDGGGFSEPEPHAGNQGASQHQSDPKFVQCQKCVEGLLRDGIKSVIRRRRSEHGRGARRECQPARLDAVEIAPQRSTARRRVIRKNNESRQMRPDVARLVVQFYQTQSAVARAVVDAIKPSYRRIRIVPIWQLRGTAQLLCPTMTRDIQLLLFLILPGKHPATLLRVQREQHRGMLTRLK